MVCPPLTSVFPQHICLIFSSFWNQENMGVSDGSWMELLENVWGLNEAVCIPLIITWMFSRTALRCVKSTTLYALTGRLIAGEQSQRGSFMVWNVNKNIALDEALKTDAWGIIPAPGTDHNKWFFLLEEVQFRLSSWKKWSKGIIYVQVGVGSSVEEWQSPLSALQCTLLCL